MAWRLCGFVVNFGLQMDAAPSRMCTPSNDMTLNNLQQISLRIEATRWSHVSIQQQYFASNSAS